MRRLFKTRWRIVTDLYLGYEVQFRWWWCPLWFQHGWTNTHPSLEAAVAYAERASRRVVCEVLS